MDGAIDWLEKHGEKSTEDLLEADAEDTTSSTGVKALSLTCDDCGKRFRDQVSAEYHASKSGHENFSESTEEVKPLTEEEKEQKLAELREKAALRKAAKAEEEKLERKRNEVCGPYCLCDILCVHANIAVFHRKFVARPQRRHRI